MTRDGKTNQILTPAAQAQDDKGRRLRMTTHVAALLRMTRDVASG